MISALLEKGNFNKLLELNIVPDKSGGYARASLLALRLSG
jgi:hypothetical protein